MGFTENWKLKTNKLTALTYLFAVFIMCASYAEVKEQFPDLSPTMWVLETKCRSPGVKASTFTTEPSPLPNTGIHFFFLFQTIQLLFFFLPQLKGLSFNTWPDCWGARSLIHADKRYLSSQTSWENAPSLIPVQY